MDSAADLDRMPVFTTAMRDWLASDPTPARLSRDSALTSLAINSSSLERFEDTDLITPSTLAFQAECAFRTRGVMFSCGKHFKRTFFREDDLTTLMPLRFLPRAQPSSEEPVAASGCVSVALDEALGGASFAGGGGFTASLDVEHHQNAPIGRTLLATCRILDDSTNDKGTRKFLVEGVLASEDGETRYSSARGLFIRPAANAFPVKW